MNQRIIVVNLKDKSIHQATNPHSSLLIGSFTFLIRTKQIRIKYQDRFTGLNQIISSAHQMKEQQKLSKQYSY